MIYIGVTGWGDHDTLYPEKVAARDKLKEYASYFPIVEVDATFYAIQPQRNVEKWVRETPEGFRFIVKAYQGMTGHQRGEIPFSSKEEMFAAFSAMIGTFQESGKLAMVLFQFPPWFDCTKENVQYLRYCREMLPGLPLALEFRNRTWYEPQYMDRTMLFMEEEGWIHTVCDEPQAGTGSVPMVLKATDKEKTLVRLHGRNEAAWRKPNGKNWREVRYLYRYNEQELLEWKENLLKLGKQSKNIYVLFNNNSGGDAADNALRLIEMLGLEYDNLAPRQLDLF